MQGGAAMRRWQRLTEKGDGLWHELDYRLGGNGGGRPGGSGLGPGGHTLGHHAPCRLHIGAGAAEIASV